MNNNNILFLPAATEEIWLPRKSKPTILQQL